MMPSARRWPRAAISASVSCRNGCQLRMPTYTGSARPARRERARAARAPGRSVSSLQRRAAARHLLVVVRDLLEPLGRDAPAARDDLEERPDLVRARRAAEGDEQDGVDRAHRALGQLVHHVDQRPHVVDGRLRVDAVAEVEDVAGAAAGAVEDRLHALADRRGRREQRRPGRDCPARRRRGRRRAQPRSRSTRQSRPITSPPASRMSGSSVAVPVPKWITGVPGVQRADHRARVRQHERRGSRRARARRPRSRRAARPGRRPRSGRSGRARSRRASTSISRCQAAGASYISRLVCR